MTSLDGVVGGVVIMGVAGGVSIMGVALVAAQLLLLHPSYGIPRPLILVTLGTYTLMRWVLLNLTNLSS